MTFKWRNQLSNYFYGVIPTTLLPCTCPNHLSLWGDSTSKHLTHTIPLVDSFLILSILVSPKEKLNAHQTSWRLQIGRVSASTVNGCLSTRSRAWWTVDTECTEAVTEYGWVETHCHLHPVYSVQAQFPNHCQRSIQMKMRKGSQRFTIKHLGLSIDSEIAHKVAVRAQRKARLCLFTAAAIKPTPRAWHWTPHSARYIDLL